MNQVFKRPHALCDVPLHYCPGCTHGIVHRLVAEVIDELEIEGKTVKVNAENARMVANSKEFDVMLIDDPMELHKHLEIYLKYTGGQ